jgi:hypothetical protein
MAGDWRSTMMRAWVEEHGEGHFEGTGAFTLLKRAGIIANILPAAVAHEGTARGQGRPRMVSIVLVSADRYKALCALEGVREALENARPGSAEVMLPSCLGEGFEDEAWRLPDGVSKRVFQCRGGADGARGDEGEGEGGVRGRGAGDLANAGSRESAGSIIMFIGGLSGCWKAPSSLVGDTLAWFYGGEGDDAVENGTGPGQRGPGGGPRESLVSFAEVPPSWGGLDGGDGGGDGEGDGGVGAWPIDASTEWIHHWWWGGWGPSIPYAALHAADGFVGGGLEWDVEVAHLMDRCRIVGYDVWLAPTRMAWSRVDSCACEGGSGSGGWIGEGLDGSLVLLHQMRRGERSVRAGGGFLL